MKQHSGLLFVLISCLLYFPLNAQNITGAKITRAQADSIFKNSGKIIYFPNINKVPYYHDATLLKQIAKYEKKKNWSEAQKALKKYVSNFGIQNFYKDADLIWKLGRLTELLGAKDIAKIYYRLALKHHRGNDVKSFQLYYDSIARNDKNYYVPIEDFFTKVDAQSQIDTLLVIPEDYNTSMGYTVNSDFNDYGPALSVNDELFLFTSKRHRDNLVSGKYNEDLFYALRYDSLSWDYANPLKEINTKYNEGSPCLSRDGRFLYFSRCDSPDGYGNCDLYMAEFVINKDGDTLDIYTQNLGPNVNSITWDSHPALSTTEDTLYFASNRIGGFGMSDIYFIHKLYKKSWTTSKFLGLSPEEKENLYNQGYFMDKKGYYVWSKAKNVGPDINTNRSEVSPFYRTYTTKDNIAIDILYFSSNGQIGNVGFLKTSNLKDFGTFDIYKSYKLPRVYTSYDFWYEPKNTGPLINHTNSDEYYFTIDSHFFDFYFAKQDTTIRFYKEEWSGDTIIKYIPNMQLHTYMLPMEAQPEALISVSGFLTDSLTGEAFDGIVSIIDLDEGIEIAPQYIREDGSFQFDLIKDNNYLIIITGEDFFRIEEEILLKGDTTLNIKTPSIKYKKWKFENIVFDGNSSEIKPSMYGDLNKLVIFLADNPRLKLKISGHTDSVGNPDVNQRLSQERADKIKQYLIDNGKFNDNRIEAIGYGSAKPLVEEKTEEDRQTNRRVEFELINDSD